MARIQDIFDVASIYNALESTKAEYNYWTVEMGEEEETAAEAAADFLIDQIVPDDERELVTAIIYDTE